VSNADVTTLGLIASLALIAVALGLSLWQRLHLERDIVWATIRSIIQLLAVGAVLLIVIDPAQPLILSWAWVAAMVVFAAVVVQRRAREVPDILRLGFLALGVSALVTLGVIFGLRVFPLEGRTLVPLAGMMIGNSMKATVVAARRVIEEIRDKRREVETRLALGQASRLAARPYVRAALRTALTPQIETTKAVGLVFLPGAMTGLILAGVNPVSAVLVQAAIMYLILGSVATTSTVVALGVARLLFTTDHRLKPLPKPAEAPVGRGTIAKLWRRLRD
jgi:putative ABC transport system permease protein